MGMLQTGKRITGIMLCIALLFAFACASAEDTVALKGTDTHIMTESADVPKTDDAVQAGEDGASPETTPVILLPFTVTFQNDDGSVINSVTVTQGQQVPKPKNVPEKEGYIFVFWYRPSAGEVPYNFKQPLASDMVLRAKYIEKIADEENNVLVVTLEGMPEGELLHERLPEPTPETDTPEDAPVADDASVVLPDADVAPPPEQQEPDSTVGAEQQEQPASLAPEETQSTTPQKPASEQADSVTGTSNQIPALPSAPNEADKPDATEPVSNTPVDNGTPENDLPVSSPVPTPDVEQPVITLSVQYEGDTLHLGDKVTIVGIVSAMPEGKHYTFQWQNNIGGEYGDVPGATGLSYSFIADKDNTNCQWRLKIIENK